MSEIAGDVDFLESIIKIEPEEFETIEQQPADDVLNSKNQKQCVLAKPNNIKPDAVKPANSEESCRDSAESLARKGNEGKSALDPHSCCICKKIFSRRRAVKEHLNRFHLKATQMSCDLCPRILFTRDAIVRHMRNSHGKQKFACGICAYKTANSANLKSHKLIHAARTECPICNKEVAFMRTHMQYHQPKENCSICQKAFMPKYLKRHLNEAHRIQKCDDCQESFESSEEFRRHKFESHYKGKLFRCHCGSLFTSRNSLREHQRSHNEEKATCEVCQKHFASMITLKHHRRTQHGSLSQLKEKIKVLNTSGPFICDKCGWKYSSRKTFLAHILAHRNPTIFCDLCPRSFTRKCSLAHHLKRDHLKLRPFQCDICQFKAFYRSELEVHKLQHSSKTECRLCHKLVANISVHLKTHVKTKCPICGKVFSKMYMSRHLKTHKKTR